MGVPKNAYASSPTLQASALQTSPVKSIRSVWTTVANASRVSLIYPQNAPNAHPRITLMVWYVSYAKTVKSPPASHPVSAATISSTSRDPAPSVPSMSNTTRNNRLVYVSPGSIGWMESAKDRLKTPSTTVQILCVSKVSTTLVENVKSVQATKSTMARLRIVHAPRTPY